MIRVAGFAICLCAAPLAAQEIKPSDIPQGKPDYHLSSAGTYRLDPMHSAVLARVQHMGFSYSVFRFDEVAAELIWNPDDPGANKLTAEVQIASITTPVPGFADILQGADYLDAARNPTARFVSDSFTASDVKTGEVSGQLTLMGQTHPATFEVQLIGAGNGFTGDAQGNPILRDLIGIHASTQIDPQAYGLNDFFTTPIPIEIDAEFVKQE